MNLSSFKNLLLQSDILEMSDEMQLKLHSFFFLFSFINLFFSLSILFKIQVLSPPTFSSFLVVFLSHLQPSASDTFPFYRFLVSARSCVIIHPCFPCSVSPIDLI